MSIRSATTRVGAVLVALFLGLQAAHAVEVRVRVALPPETDEVRTTCTVSATDGDNDAVGSAPFEGSWAELALDLKPDRMWTITATVPGFWAPDAAVLVREQPSAVAISLHPTTLLSGLVQVEDGQERPTGLTARFTAPETGAGALLAGDVDCQVSPEGELACELPVGTWDLRLRAEGCVSHFFWAMDLVRGETADLGALRLQRGASVTGWVELSAEAGLEGCTLTLIPEIVSTRTEEAGQNARQLTTRPDGRGFFHFSGVAPGSYELVAEHPALAPLRIPDVPVYAGSESEISRPLVLRPPVTLEVSLDPPGDPSGEPWLVALFEGDVRRRRLRSVTDPVPAAGGLWRHDGMAPGSYLVQVADRAGSTWEQRMVVLDAASESVHFQLPLIQVIGSVTLGTRPIAAELRFSEPSRDGTGGAVIRLSALEDGTFEGMVPRPGTWNVNVTASDPELRRTIEVEIEPESGFAQVNIDLPDRSLTGTVRDEDGRTVADVRVTLMGAGVPGDLSWTETDTDGRFEFAAITPGLFNLQARTAGAASADAMTEVPAGDRSPQPVDLVLHPLDQLRGTVVSPSGGAIPGAYVLRFAPGVYSNQLVTTGLDGSFSLRVPGGQHEVVVVAMAAGFALYSRRVTMRPGLDLTIELGQEHGTLQLDVDPGLVAGGVVQCVVGEALVVPLSVLGMWAELNGVPRSVQVDSPLRVPMMPTGSYSHCLLTAAELDVVLRQGTGTGHSCTSGHLTAGGELELSLPGS